MATVFILLGFSVTMSLVSGCFFGKYNSSATDTFELKIPEGLLKDDIVDTYSLTDNITLRAETNSNLPSFLVAREGSLYINAALDFDNNVTLCAETGPWIIRVGCVSHPTKEIFILTTINYTDNFNPEIAGNHSINVSELTLVDTELFNLNRLNAYVFDRDCDSNIGNIIYGLEEDYSLAFILYSNILYLNRILDFESGDKKFDLNISVTTPVTSPDRKGYTLLTVNVIDADENIFCHCNQTTETPKPGSTVTVGDFENVTTGSIWTDTPLKQVKSTTTVISTVIE